MLDSRRLLTGRRQNPSDREHFDQSMGESDGSSFLFCYSGNLLGEATPSPVNACETRRRIAGTRSGDRRFFPQRGGDAYRAAARRMIENVKVAGPVHASPMPLLESVADRPQFLVSPRQEAMECGSSPHRNLSAVSSCPSRLVDRVDRCSGGRSSVAATGRMAMHSHLLEDVFACTNPSPPPPPPSQQQEKKPRPQPEQALRCPRCDSTNTKFCYYNNYSLSQPRYFCKGCRRYWTKGGTLRNVPVGGGCRKTKRSSSSSSSSKKIQDQALLQTLASPPPPLPLDHRDSFAPPSFLEDSLNPYSALCYGLEAQAPAPPTWEMLSGAAAANKQEPAHWNGDSTRLLLGLPWPFAADGDVTGASGRELWNGIGSTWHGLVNSFLI